MTSRRASKEGSTLDTFPGDLKRVLLGTASKKEELHSLLHDLCCHGAVQRLHVVFSCQTEGPWEGISEDVGFEMPSNQGGQAVLH